MVKIIPVAVGRDGGNRQGGKVFQGGLVLDYRLLNMVIDAG